MTLTPAEIRESVAAEIRYLTPPTIARRLGVKSATVSGWIVSGQLRGVNLAAAGCSRPRFKVDPADLAIFLNRRAAGTQPKVTRRRRKDEGVIQYF